MSRVFFKYAERKRECKVAQLWARTEKYAFLTENYQRNIKEVLKFNFPN